jgi:hypothetical protein
MKIKRLFLLLAAAVLTVSAVAQSPEAIRASLAKYPNLAYPVASTYPSVPLGEIAAAPEGFEPFYFTLVGRHGSRYEQKGSRFNKVSATLDKAHELGILTKDGELLRERAKAIAEAQKDHDGELSDLGAEQWRGIAHRAYDRFSKVFDKGFIEGKSSTSLRCVLSMVAFNDAMKEKNPKIKVHQQARASELWIVRPLANNPAVSKEAKELCANYNKSGEWTKARREWERSYDASDFLSKITTDKTRLLEECGGKKDERMLRYSFITLLFGENFELGDRALLNRLFSVDDLYFMYVYQTSNWVNNSIGRGNEFVEARQSHMEAMILDILGKGNAAIKGENPNCANLRFTHDSYVGPLLSAMGYDGCVPQWNENIEIASTSFNHGLNVPMAANLQIILYRDKAGKVFVRSLINERDATLPIKCATAPFYPWEDFSKHVLNNIKELKKSEANILKNIN